MYATRTTRKMTVPNERTQCWTLMWLYGEDSQWLK